MKLNKINLSGVSYDIEDLNAAKTVELTQAQYDALTVKDPNTFYVITDAEPVDMSDYYTKSETSGATQISTALAGKADTATTYTKTEVDNAITAATSTKQDTLVSGTNIKTVNNESLLGEGNITIEGGGGATYSAGTNISIDTANTINCTLNLRNGSGENSLVGTGAGNIATKEATFSFGQYLTSSRMYGVSFGLKNVFSESGSKYTFGESGNTLFSIGNGNRNGGQFHNALDIRQNGDIYFPDTDNTTYQGYYEKPMVRLQDMYVELGNKLETSAITSAITSASTDSQVPSAKAVYDALQESGGGAEYSAGTNISIDANNAINCTLPIRVDDSSKQAISLGSSSVASGYNSLAFGNNCQVSGANSFSVGSRTNADGFASVAFGIRTTTNNITQASFGSDNITNGNSDYFAGGSGNTLFSVGNGITSVRHNAFEIRQNGDIYFPDTDNTTYANYYQKPMVRLQDMYGALGGLKLVKLTQTEYDALATKDSNTLYVIVN